MVDFLELIHLIKDLLLYMVISPTKIEIHAHYRVCYLQIFHLFGSQPHHWILRVCVLRWLPLTLITTFG